MSLSRALEVALFEAEFERFQRTAFRLETLPEYKVDEEKDVLAQFQSGQPQPEWHRNRAWTDQIRSYAARGKAVERVHVVQEPLTDYLQFELKWAYTSNEAAGELIFIRTDAQSIEPLEDFWIFDESRVIRMFYDKDYSYVGAELLDTEAGVAKYRLARDRARLGAIPLAQYLSRSPK